MAFPLSKKFLDVQNLDLILLDRRRELLDADSTEE